MRSSDGTRPAAPGSIATAITRDVSHAAVASNSPSHPPAAAGSLLDAIPRDVLAFVLLRLLDRASIVRVGRLHRRTHSIMAQVGAAHRPPGVLHTDKTLDWDVFCRWLSRRRRRYMSPLQLVHFSRSPAMQLEFDIALVVQCDKHHRLVSHIRGLGNHSPDFVKTDITLEQVQAALQRFKHVQGLTLLISYVSSNNLLYTESFGSLSYLNTILKAWAPRLCYLNINLPPSVKKSLFEEFIIPHFGQMTRLQLLDINADGWSDAASFAQIPFHRAPDALAPPLPFTEADQAAIAASNFLVSNHRHPLVLYSKRYVNGASCDQCSKSIPGKAYACNECRYDLHPECFVAAGGHDAWLVEKPDPFFLTPNGLILFHTRYRIAGFSSSSSRTDKSLGQLQFELPLPNRIARWYFSDDSRWPLPLPQDISLAPLALSCTAAVVEALSTYHTTADAAVKKMVTEAFGKKFELFHRRGLQSMDLVLPMPLAGEILVQRERQLAEQFQLLPPLTGRHPLRHLATDVQTEEDCAVLKTIFQLIPPAALAGVTRVTFTPGPKLFQQIANTVAVAPDGPESERRDAVAKIINQRLEHDLNAMIERLPRLYHLTVSLPMEFTSFGVCFKQITHLTLLRTEAEPDSMGQRTAAQIHLIAVEMRLLQSLSVVHTRGWSNSHDVCVVLLPLLVSSATLREVTYSLKHDLTQLTPSPHRVAGSISTREDTPMRRLHLLWKHLQPSHPLPDVSHATADFPDFVRADSLHPRLLLPFLTTEDRLKYAQRMEKYTPDAFHTVGSVSLLSTGQTAPSSAYSVSSSASSSSVSGLSALASASMWNLSQRVFSTVLSPLTALQRQRDDAAAASRRSNETQMWSDAKGSYLASLTMHFHPVREVEVAVRPIRIRLLHHNTFDTYFMDEWLAEHRR